MERKMSINLYVGAFIITSLLFIAGFLIGSKYQEHIYYSLGEEVRMMEERMMDITLLMLVEDSEYFCEIYNEKLPQLDQDTYLLGEKLEYMENKKGIYDEDTKKRYFELELRDFILMTKAENKCDIDIPMLLYFYNNKDCKKCYEQGYEITKARKDTDKNNKVVRVYTFDGSINSAVVRALKEKYNIDEYPTIVVINKNETNKLEGYHNKEELCKILRTC